MKRAVKGTDSDPKLSGLDSAIAWLADRDIPVSLLADHFGTNRTHVRQLIYRGRNGPPKEKLPRWLVAPLQSPNNPFDAPNQKLRRQLGVREGHDTVCLYRSGRLRLNDLEEIIDQLGTDFWTGVRYGSEIETLRVMRQRIGFVAHLPRLRIRARLEHLIAETYLHGGKSLSALKLALFALHLWRVTWAESEDRNDLKEMARTTLLISQAHLVRLEPERAKEYLDTYEQACARAHAPLGAEYFRQRAVISFQREDWEHAREHFFIASRVLEPLKSTGAESRSLKC